MLSESVAQNPIIAVSAGKKNAQNLPAFGWPAANADGVDSIGPKPPAWTYAHASSAKPRRISSGALMLSRKRIDSTPLWITYMLTAQNARKQAHCPALRP